MPCILRKSIIQMTNVEPNVERNHAIGLVLASVGFLISSTRTWPGITVPNRNKQSIAVGFINQQIKQAREIKCGIGFGVCHAFSFSK